MADGLDSGSELLLVPAFYSDVNDDGHYPCVQVELGLWKSTTSQSHLPQKR